MLIDSTDVEHVTKSKQLVHVYAKQPITLENMCLYEFAAQYSLIEQKIANTTQSIHVVRHPKDYLSLINNSGFIHPRKTKVVVKCYPHFPLDFNNESAAYAMLQMYLPWRNLDEDVALSNAVSILGHHRIQLLEAVSLNEFFFNKKLIKQCIKNKKCMSNKKYTTLTFNTNLQIHLTQLLYRQIYWKIYNSALLLQRNYNI